MGSKLLEIVSPCTIPVSTLTCSSGSKDDQFQGSHKYSIFPGDGKKFSSQSSA